MKSKVLNKVAQLILMSVALLALLAFDAQADETPEVTRLAQFDADDTYDPFADYS